MPRSVTGVGGGEGVGAVAPPAMVASVTADLTGNIDFVGGVGISIVADDLNDTVTISNTSPAGGADHGALTGLLDDDHTQYTLADGTRAFSGNVSLGDNNLDNVGEINMTTGATIDNLETLNFGGSFGHSITTLGGVISMDPNGTTAAEFAESGMRAYLPVELQPTTEPTTIALNSGQLWTEAGDDNLYWKPNGGTKTNVLSTGGDFFADGSVPMTDTLNMAGNAISACGLIQTNQINLTTTNNFISSAETANVQFLFNSVEKARFDTNGLSMSTEVDMGANRIVDVGTPTAATDAATKDYVDTEVTGAVVTDHGALTGLGDDDHTQYTLANGTRAFTGTVDVGGNFINNVDTIQGVTGADLDFAVGTNQAYNFPMGGVSTFNVGGTTFAVANSSLVSTSVPMSIGGDVNMNNNAITNCDAYRGLTGNAVYLEGVGAGSSIIMQVDSNVVWFANTTLGILTYYNVDMNANTVTNVADPSAESDVTPRSYVDAMCNQYHFQQITVNSNSDQDIDAGETSGWPLWHVMHSDGELRGCTVMIDEEFYNTWASSPTQTVRFRWYVEGVLTDDVTTTFSDFSLIGGGTTATGSSINNGGIVFTSAQVNGTFTAGQGLAMRLTVGAGNINGGELVANCLWRPT